MSEIMPCPDCEDSRVVEIVEYDEVVSAKGKDVSFRAKAYRCIVCGGLFYTAEMMDRNLEFAKLSSQGAV